MPVTLKQDVPLELIWYLRENQAHYPGGDRRPCVRPPLPAGRARGSPSGTCASRAGGAQEARYQELEPGDEIGKDGVELTYDHVLRGVNEDRGSPSTRRACRAASRPA